MKRTLVSLAVMMAVAAMANPVLTQGKPEMALLDASAARLKALGAGDGDTWGKYTTDDFRVVESDGALKTKAQRMNEIKATKESAAATAPSDQALWRVYGPSTAIAVAHAPVDGKPTRITTVWVKQQGDWKVASVQLTTITAAK
jgi:hypothetical protein